VPEPTEFQRRFPNLLTAARVVLAAVFVVVLALWERPERRGDPVTIDAVLAGATAVFILAAVTDWLDGMLARRWRVVSVFGRIMDPFADKALVVGAFVMLSGPAFAYAREDGTTYQASGIWPWMAVLVLARELLVTSLRGVIESMGRSFAATGSGKAKMVLQSVSIPVVLAILSVSDAPPASAWRWVIDVLVWLTVIVTVLSGWPYGLRAWASLKESEPVE
jgi:CDP-diacylglycerol--glycerol-3-phosphate 3-phosphatidyltransferase